MIGMKPTMKMFGDDIYTEGYVPLCRFHIYTLSFILIFMFQLSGVINRNSSAVSAMYADVLNGKCSVHFKNGAIYDYTNVSRRALFDVLNNENASLGFFVNNSLLACDSKCAMYGDAQAWAKVSLA